MTHHGKLCHIQTQGRGLTNITSLAVAFTEECGLRSGLLVAWIRHTSASLIVTENADPEVLRDHERFLARCVPDGDPIYQHVDEGPDDMPAHVRSILTQTSLTIPFHDGVLQLGTWQGLFLWEHRHAPHSREVFFHLSGE